MSQLKDTGRFNLSGSRPQGEDMSEEGKMKKAKDIELQEQ